MKTLSKTTIILLIGIALTLTVNIGLRFNKDKTIKEPMNEIQYRSTSTLQVDPTPASQPEPRVQNDSNPSEITRRINYKPISSWPTFNSPVGYSLQYPLSLGENGPHTEFRDGSCFTFISNNVGGVMSFKVAPYNGGSRRKLYFGENTPTWTTIKYEDIQLAGTPALVIYFGSEESPEYGLGMAAIIPKGNAALIVDYPRRKEVSEWQMILGTIQMNSSFDLSKCLPSS